jgi:hypothetical protein
VAVVVAYSRVIRRQSIAATGSNEATWAMAALSRRTRSSLGSVTGGGSEPRRVWTSWQQVSLARSGRG